MLFTQIGIDFYALMSFGEYVVRVKFTNPPSKSLEKVHFQVNILERRDNF